MALAPGGDRRPQHRHAVEVTGAGSLPSLRGPLGSRRIDGHRSSGCTALPPVDCRDYLESIVGEVREDDQATRLHHSQEFLQDGLSGVEVVQDVDGYGGSEMAVRTGSRAASARGTVSSSARRVLG